LKYTGNIDKYTTTENQSSLNNKPRTKILSTHEIRDKPPTVKFKINMVLDEIMNTKYAIATEQSSNHVIKDNHGNKSFYSQYLQAVLKITNNNGNSNNYNGTFNIMMPLLLYQIIQIHPFIEYLQPEPEPAPLNSCFIFIFLLLFIGTTRQKVVSFILSLLYYLNNMNSLTLTLITNHSSETLSYINIKTVLTQLQEKPSMVQFILFCSTYRP
jgi:hypothetical protein